MTKDDDKKVRNIPMRVIIPNMITSGSVFCGVSSLILTAHERFVPAALLICFASFFDLMDGRVARTLGGGSAFGEQLDSLADAISFGVAPAFLIYCAFIGPKFGVWGPLGASAFALCGVLRLARFNITHVPEGPFQGLPIPAGGLSLCALVFSRLPVTPLIAMTALIGVGLLMVSSVPYCNAKKLKRANVNRARFYGVIAFMVLCFIVLREKALLALAIMYITSGLLRFDLSEWVMVSSDEESETRGKDE